MLPVGTPPNAIVFSSGVLESKDMLKTGIVMNGFCILFVSFWSYFAGRIFGISVGEIPSWATNVKK